MPGFDSFSMFFEVPMLTSCMFTKKSSSERQFSFWSVLDARKC